MAPFETDKSTSHRETRRGFPVAEDARCESCGYSLRGLRTGGVCPECGTPIVPRRHKDVAFDEMPMPLIRGYRASCWMATAAIAGLVALAIMQAAAARWSAGLALGLVTAVVGLWLVAVSRLTRPLDQPVADRHGFGPGSRMRRAARWTQLGWPALLVAAAIDQLRPALALPGWFSAGLHAAGLLVGIVGLALLALFLSRFAEWVRDEYASKAFQVAVSGMVILGVGLVTTPVVVALGGFGLLLVPWLVVLMIVVLIMSALAFPVGLFSLSRSVDWSLVHARERADRARSLHERVAAAARQAPVPAPEGEIELAEARPDPPEITPEP